ncbi:MAG: phosphotransferase [Firmicutes bacterium]|nr:phosphotransferase [Bacillota bacterium]
MIFDLKKAKLIGQGNTAEIFEWDKDSVLKLYRHGMPDNFCLHEFKITKYAHEYLKIAPRSIKIVSIDGRVGAIYQRLVGKTMLKLLRPWNIKRYSKMLANCHVLMQKSTEFKTTTVKEKLKQDIESVSLLTAQEKELIYKYLAALPGGDSICHLDFHPDNIMISADKYYVFDWMTGCIGDPHSDAARTALILNYAKIPRVPFFVNAIAGVFQRSICKKYLNEYFRLTNASPLDIQKWELPIAAARLCEWIPEGEFQRLIKLVKSKLKLLSSEKAAKAKNNF